MALTQYCEFDEVRAALGVNSIELPNTVLSLPVYEIGLVRELAKISESLPAAFLSVSDLDMESRTAAQQQLYDAAHLFSVYAAASQVGISLGALAPKDVSDGKSSMSRFSDSPYKDTLERIATMLAGAKAFLIEAFAAINPSTSQSSSTVPFTVFKASGRSYDPVTGS